MGTRAPIRKEDPVPKRKFVYRPPPRKKLKDPALKELMAGSRIQKSAKRPRVVALSPKYQLKAKWVVSLGLRARAAPGRNTSEAFPLNCAPMPKADAPVQTTRLNKPAKIRALTFIKILLRSSDQDNNNIRKNKPGCQ
jgi:hypothetical protein